MEEGLEYTVPRVLQGISLVLGKDPEKHQLKLELFDIAFHNGKLNILVEKYVQWIFSYLKKKKKLIAYVGTLQFVLLLSWKIESCMQKDLSILCFPNKKDNRESHSSLLFYCSYLHQSTSSSNASPLCVYPFFPF